MIPGPSLLVRTAFACVLLSVRPTSAQAPANSLDAVYRDETHCLVAPEIRGPADNPISCYCRDALADAHYVYQTYLITGKDRNLNGAYLSLAQKAEQACGTGYSDIQRAAKAKVWRWEGPEVTRLYPPDSQIEKLKPDANGLRTVQYEVRLTFRDGQGRVLRVETFKATERLPRDFKGSCPAGAVCPK